VQGLGFRAFNIERRGLLMSSNNKEKVARTFAIGENTAEKFWDMWLVSLGSMSWTQEQIEGMVVKYLEQRKVAREETTKLVEELMQQAKKNQQEMQKMIQEAVNVTFENADIPGMNYFNELNKKIEDLSKKVENL